MSVRNANGKRTGTASKPSVPIPASGAAIIFTRRLKEYVSGDCHVNGIGNFWKHLKGSINGTYMSVSKKHMAKCAKEFEFRFNSREKPSAMFPALVPQFPQP
jgi:hypothetical protein